MTDNPLDPLKKAQKRYEASEKGKSRNKEYKERNKEKLKAYRKEWYANKIATDPDFAEKERERVRKAAARYYQKKKAKE